MKSRILLVWERSLFFLAPFIAALQTDILISNDHSVLFHHANTENGTDRTACKFLFSYWWPSLFLWCLRCQNVSPSIFRNANTRDILRGGKAEILSAVGFWFVFFLTGYQILTDTFKMVNVGRQSRWNFKLMHAHVLNETGPGWGPALLRITATWGHKFHIKVLIKPEGSRNGQSPYVSFVRSLNF